jgi:hypothetical protein
LAWCSGEVHSSNTCSRGASSILLSTIEAIDRAGDDVVEAAEALEQPGLHAGEHERRLGREGARLLSYTVSSVFPS